MKYFAPIEILYYYQLLFPIVVWCYKYIVLQHHALLLGTNSNVPKARKTWSKGEEPAFLKAFDCHFKLTTNGKMECLQARKKYPILRRRTWENSKHKVQNFKLEIQRQSVNGNLVKQNLGKGKKIWKIWAIGWFI